MRGKVVGLVAIGWSLACSGMEIPGMEPEVPADPAVTELLDAERGDDPALEGDALAARTASLQAFLAGTTDWADWKPATVDCLARGELRPVLDFMRDRVHRHGHLFPADEVIRRATGRGLSVEAFVGYLQRKYGG